MAILPISFDSATSHLSEEERLSRDIPEIITTAIAASFQKLSQQSSSLPGQGSLFKRITEPVNDYFFGHENPISLPEIIEKIDHPFQILDIGCGSGAIASSIMQKHNQKVTIFGVDAKPAKNLHANYFIQGNAERLSSIKALSQIKFTLIVSIGTFRHFVDPKQALIEAYDMLSPDGILLIDQIIFPGLEKTIDKIILHLQAEGYSVHVQYKESDPRLDFFTIQKTKDKLDLPFQYNIKKPLQFNCAQYTLEEPILNIEIKEHKTLREFLDIPKKVEESAV